jgi:hypothetical protein
VEQPPREQQQQQCQKEGSGAGLSAPRTTHWSGGFL